jgi:hypothetical protein
VESGFPVRKCDNARTLRKHRRGERIGVSRLNGKNAAMSIAAYLKSQAERSLRQAAQVDDEKAALQLTRLAADYLARAATLEQAVEIPKKQDDENRDDEPAAQ